MSTTMLARTFQSRRVCGGGDWWSAYPLIVLAAYRYPEPTSEEWKNVNEGWDEHNPSRHFYSRYTTNTGTRVEKILGELHVSVEVLSCPVSFTDVRAFQGGYALIYSSGLSAGFAVGYVNQLSIRL